jgi:hypothetical protein
MEYGKYMAMVATAFFNCCVKMNQLVYDVSSGERVFWFLNKQNKDYYKFRFS